MNSMVSWSPSESEPFNIGPVDVAFLLQALAQQMVERFLGPPCSWAGRDLQEDATPGRGIPRPVSSTMNSSPDAHARSDSDPALESERPRQRTVRCIQL